MPIRLSWGGIERVVVYDTRISAFNAPGGMVNRYVSTKTRTIAAVARFLCPARTGALRASISSGVTPSAGGTTGDVGAGSVVAYYAPFVLHGTGNAGTRTSHGGRIYGIPHPVPASGSRPRLVSTYGMLWVPVSTGGRKWVHSVKGQEANDFLGTALESVMGHSRFLGAGRRTMDMFQ